MSDASISDLQQHNNSAHSCNVSLPVCCSILAVIAAVLGRLPQGTHPGVHDTSGDPGTSPKLKYLHNTENSVSSVCVRK